ncbi:MAG TPA: hypothetical protein VH951_00710 [Dehalococcoidia bacterium]|jgi:hypothetical protein
MSVNATQTCGLKKSLFGVCGGPGRGICVYCGRSFCDQHGIVQEDGQEICLRKECVAKREDLVRHLAYKDLVGRLNDRRACGIPNCRSELAAQCIRCKGFFCVGHVHQRDEMVLENSVRVHHMATLCQHCYNRRGIWTKV